MPQAPADTINREDETVAQGDPAVDPAAHQPTKADTEAAVSIDATPEALARAVTRGGAERGQDKILAKKS